MTKRRSVLVAVGLAMATAITVGVQAAGSDSAPTLTAAQISLFTTEDANMTAVAAADPATDPPPGQLEVKPQEFDPGKTDLVQAEWSGAEGCPNNVGYPVYPDTQPSATYTEPACSSGSDPSDHENDGLVLDKMGPTANNASAFAVIKGVKGPLTELGYDIRKWGPGTRAGANGSHCGAGAPRFDVYTTAGGFFVGCQSPPPTVESDGQAWIRLRWGTSAGVVGYSATTGLPTVITGNVEHIYVVFDEGTDTGPDFFGAAVLDNIDVNGLIGGTGPEDNDP